MSSLQPSLHPDAFALTAYRILPDGRGRQYTATTFPKDPYVGCLRILRQAWQVGAIMREPGNSYAVIDVLNDNGDIIQDYMVPTARCFRWIKSKLSLDVEATDGDLEVRSLSGLTSGDRLTS